MIFLSLGSNLKNRKKQLKKAINHIEKLVKIVAVSPIYQTEPIGFKGNDFYNIVLALETKVNAEILLQVLLHIEDTMGRTRNQRGYENRIIDIDLICYHQKRMATPKLTLPHPRFHQRKFVLQPFADIAPDYRPYPNGKTIRELLEDCDDLTEVKRVRSQGLT